MIESIESDYIHDGNDDNFASLVIDNSNVGPVVVNFWSRKAGPCLRQYPILDKLVHDYQGRILLVNIDTEKQGVLSKKYGIASVPTLKLMRFGEVKVTLHGYQAESDLRTIFDKYVARDSDKIIEQAVQEYSQGNQEKAYQLLSDAIIDDQINPRLPLTLCKLLKHEKRYDEAYHLLEAIPPSLQDEPEIEQFQSQLFFLKRINPDEDINTILAVDNKVNDDLVHRQKLSSYYVLERRYESALQQLEKIIIQNHNFDENFARKAMLKIFSIIGEDHTLVQKYRPLLLKYTH